MLLAVAPAILAPARQRLSSPSSGSPAPQQPSRPDGRRLHAAQLQRRQSERAETRRLDRLVQLLAADRERLLARIGSLERSLDDVTGSIKSRPRCAAAPPLRAPPAPVAAPAPSGQDRRHEAAADACPAGPGPPARRDRPAGPPLRSATGRRRRTGSNSGDGPPSSASTSAARASFDGLRDALDSISAKNAALLEGLHPIVAARENRRAGAAAGCRPGRDCEAAARICAALAAASAPASRRRSKAHSPGAAGSRPRRQAGAGARPAAVGRVANPLSGDCRGACCRGIVRHAINRLFLPSARQTNWLLIVGFLALGEALYLRYLAIEYAPVSLACQGGLQTWLCATFRTGHRALQ